jgi:transmembrane sensor
LKKGPSTKKVKPTQFDRFMTYLKNLLRFRKLLHKALHGNPTDSEWSEFDRLLGNYSSHLTAEQVEQLAAQYQMQEGDSENEFVENAHKQMLEMMAPEQQRTVPFYRSKVWMVAAATISLALVFGLWFVGKDKGWFNQSLAEEAGNWATINGKGVETLPDGTKVTLNENSQLKYSRGFGKSNREVSLIGEATFDVTHDPTKPFLVHTGKITTKVLGTEFNVHAYPDDEKVTVTVLRGLVEVSDEQKIYGQIKPNEQIAVNVHSLEFVQEEVKAEQAVQWKANFIVLDNVTLEEAASILEKRFKMKVTFENPELKKCRIIGSFLNDETLERVLSLMTGVINITYTIEEDGNVVLKGKGCS